MAEHLTDEELARRTQNLLGAAEQVALNLKVQNEKLASVVEQLEQEVLEPLRKEVERDGRE